MNQEWNKHITLDESLIERCKQIKPIDILVGVLCKDVETTVLNVLNVVNEGLYQFFPDYRTVIAISKAPSSDRTDDVIRLFQPYHSIEMIVTDDMTTSGKGAGIMTILELAHETKAKCVVLLDGDLLNIKPSWLQSIANPIVYGRADLTVPYYIRDKNDGVITNNLVYPFTRALYGIDIRQPIAGEFALSKNLYEHLRNHPLFPPDFGVDIFIVTSAAAEGMYVKEGLFSLKIHESTTRYLEPENFLIPMFRKVTGSMFALAKYYESYWRKKPNRWKSSYYRECFSKNPIPVTINIKAMKESFQQDFQDQKHLFHRYITDHFIIKIDQIIKDNINFDAEIWADIVYQYASAYKNTTTDEGKQLLLDTLKTLWIGRFVSYAEQVETMDINEAEKVIQHQAEIFEDRFDFLKGIY